MSRWGHVWCLGLILAAVLWLAPSGVQAQQEKAERWSLVGFTKYRDAVFIDKQGWVLSSPGVVRTWIKIAPAVKSRYAREARRELRKQGTSAEGLNHTEIENEMDCENNRMRFLQNRYFNENGALMHAQVYADRKWRPVQPGSLWDKVRQAACIR